MVTQAGAPLETATPFLLPRSHACRLPVKLGVASLPYCHYRPVSFRRRAPVSLTPRGHGVVSFGRGGPTRAIAKFGCDTCPPSPHGSLAAGNGTEMTGVVAQ